MTPKIDHVPGYYVAVVAPDGNRWAVITHWLDPNDPETAAELASWVGTRRASRQTRRLVALRGAYVTTAAQFRNYHTWDRGAWRRVS